ncbi:hypothetical protein BU26DRAFT_480279 [Trematosphaeria pertusa]|uniref:DASH complex subunit DAM1 n=1 Tax=Trematosphaeria pertusa TaxID=390896 RepID=A0A6A6IR52_9PLEO|nr:uncharacterized protein BU26DRAFT_480279 [Trematosphaeria pertusa]KAF2252558.1 hypothetical protein BU26DRAFT_480279 [Trematosphaeria pertusa]
MTSTTPTAEPPSYHRRTRSKSPRSRPTTPLRPSSRSSLRDSAQRGRGPYAHSTNPLEDLQDGFGELSDAMADLEQNFMQLQLMHESLARFSESFASFLYGLNMNAFCVDFPEAPVSESFKRPQNNPEYANLNRSQGPEPDIEATFLTTDTSFVENPPSSKATSKFQTPVTPAPASKTSGAARGRGGISRVGRGGGIPTRGGATRGTRGGSGIARGAGRGRGAR